MLTLAAELARQIPRKNRGIFSQILTLCRYAVVLDARLDRLADLLIYIAQYSRLSIEIINLEKSLVVISLMVSELSQPI